MVDKGHIGRPILRDPFCAAHSARPILHDRRTADTFLIRNKTTLLIWNLIGLKPDGKLTGVMFSLHSE